METPVICRSMERSLRIIGAWPDSGNVLIRYFIWTSKAFLIGVLFWNIPRVFDDPRLLMEALSNFSLATFGLVKIATVWKNRRNLKIFLYEMADDWTDARDGGEQTVMLRQGKIARICYVSITAMYCGTIISYSFSSIANYHFGSNDTEGRVLILGVKYPFDAKRTPLFEIICLAEMYFGLQTCSALALVDGLLVSMILHVCGQLTLLQNKIIGLTSVGQIAGIVRKHQKIIEMSESVDALFSLLGLAQVFISTMLFCFMGYMVIFSLESAEKMVILKFSLYLVSTLLVTCFYCFSGDYLSSQSPMISSAAYESRWYEMRPRDRKMLMLIMLRAQKPLKMTAGKFMDLSLENFTDILKASASYLSALRAMY